MSDPRRYRILILAQHFPVAGGRYLARAFERLGHEVQTCGGATGRSIWEIEVSPRHVWQPDIEDIVEADSWGADLAISAWFGMEMYGRTPLVVWSIDNHVQANTSRAAHYFLAHHDGEAQPVDASREDMTWLPCAADSEYFNRRTMPHERPIHAAMIGNIYNRRAAVLAAVSGEFHVIAGLGPLFDEYAALYNRAVVSICCPVKQDAANRIFETARMGCVMLCEPVPDFERLGFLPDVHYLPFTTPAEATEQMRALFSGPADRIAELAHNAYQWSLPHTWEARAQTVIDVLQRRGILVP